MTLLSGSSKITYPTIFQYGNENIETKRGSSVLSSAILKQSSPNKDNGSISFKQSAVDFSPTDDSYFSNSASSLTNGSLADGRAGEEVQSSKNGGTDEVLSITNNRPNLNMNILDEGLVNGSLDFEHFFQEESCEASPLNECHKSAGVVTDVDNSSTPCDKQKSEEDGENDKSEEDSDSDGMLGGVFAFSEEGRNLKVEFSQSFYTILAVKGYDSFEFDRNIDASISYYMPYTLKYSIFH